MEVTYGSITLGPASTMTTVAYCTNTPIKRVCFFLGGVVLVSVCFILSLRNYGQLPPLSVNNRVENNIWGMNVSG